MKKLLFALTALAMLAVSCVDEIHEPERLETKGLSLKAAVEMPAATRSVIEKETQVYWEPGDELSVFAGNLSGRFSSDLSETAATTTFWGSLGDSSWPAGQDIWAVYPYNAVATYDGSSVTTELPSVQVARAGSFAKGMNLAVAKASTPSMQFYNVGGGVRFSLANDGVTKVELEGLNGEVLAGKVRIGFQEGLPAVLDVIEGSTTLTLAAPEGETLLSETWYYLVAIPGTLDKGFTLTFYQEGAKAQKVFDSKVTIKRGVYGTLYHADAGANYSPDSDENINFVDATVKSIVVRYFDTSGDGELSYREAAAVKSFLVAGTRAEEGGTSIFAGTGITTFEEIVYFTGLTKIEDGAFAGCTELKAIIIPDTVTEIGANAFKGCTQLQYVLLQSTTPPTIGTDAFSDTNNCPIYVPAGSTDQYVSAWSPYAERIDPGSPVPDNEIWYTTTDGKALVPGYSRQGMTDEGAFGANVLSNEYVGGKGVITFDGPVNKIGRYAFYYNKTLETILYPKTVEMIRGYGFCGCSNLVSIVLPSQQTEIQGTTFYNCRALTRVELPNALKTISANSFYNCIGLSNIFFPAKVSSVAAGAFNGCTGLSEIVVSPDNPVYDSRENCNAIIQTATNTLVRGCYKTKIPVSVAVISSSAFSGCLRLEEVEVPEGVSEVGSAAFGGCSDLKKIVFPASTTKIGLNVIGSCPALSTVIVASGNPVYDSRENCNAIIETATNTLFAGCPASTIPGSVTSIGQSAFYDCKALTGITIPESVTIIGAQAFQRCGDLSEITIPASVEVIYGSAFSDCTGLVRITLSEGLKTISGNAFYGCTSLSEVTVPASVTSFGASVFNGCTGLTSVTMLPPSPPQDAGNYMFYNTNNCPIYVPEESVEAYKSAQYWNQYANRIRALPGKKLYYTSSDGNIVTPSSPDAFGARIMSNEYVDGKGILTLDGVVTRIGDGAFDGCGTLTGIEIPEGVTEIGKSAFSGCTAMTVINIPPKVVYIGQGAFSGCSRLYTVNLSTGISTLEDEVFSQCESLRNISIPTGITEIGEKAFSGCKNLLRITVPLQVKRIGAQAFNGCRQLYTITVLPTVPPTGAAEMFDDTGQRPIYVLAGSGEAYKSAPYWSNYADRIQELSGNIINYTSYNAEPVTLYNSSGFGANIVSNEYLDGRGILTFDGPITNVPNAAFYNSGLTEIMLPEGVKQLASSAFDHCGRMTKIVIPDGVTSIGSRAFYHCYELVEATLPDTVSDIGSEAFCNCSSLKTVRIPEGVTVINSGTFQYCHNLKNATLPNSLTSIGVRAFEMCESLLSITIPAKVATLNDEAFYDCYRLTEMILLPETPPACGSRVFSISNQADSEGYPIYVPAGCSNAYKSADNWKVYSARFREIGVKDRVMALETMLAQAWNQFSSYKAQLQEKASAEAAPELYNRAAELEQSWYYMMERLPMITTIDETYAMQAMLEEFMKRLDDFSYLVEQYGKS